MKNFIQKFKAAWNGEFRPLWLTIATILFFDALDCTVSKLDNKLIPIWQEGNQLTRTIPDKKLLILQAFYLHMIWYVVFGLALYLLHKFLRHYFTQKNTILIVCIPLWLNLYATVDAVFGNIGLLMYWFTYLKYLPSYLFIS